VLLRYTFCKLSLTLLFCYFLFVCSCFSL
jgi:hypothetical protein